ncbi:MAG: nucleoside-diphosphate kinase [Methanosarcinales archaeon]
MEQTFLMIKPDGVLRGLIGEIISKIEKKGLKIVAMKMLHIDKKLASIHYEEHKNKDFYNSLIEYITCAPTVVMVLEGQDAVTITRNLVGATNPKNANSGTIRGDFGMNIKNYMFNLVHASDSIESADKEINRFFNKKEILKYKRLHETILP